MSLHLTVNNIDTDIGLTANSDSLIASQKAVKAFVLASGGGVLDTVPTLSSTNGVQSGGVATALNGKQALNVNLTTISGLTSGNDDVLQRKAGVWASRTIAQLKVDLAYTKTDVGLSNVDNTSDAAKPISTATQTALNLRAPIASPALTGTPTTPTATLGTNTTQIASTAFVLANIPTSYFDTSQYSGNGLTSETKLVIANLPGSVITSGTVAAARLPSTLAYKDGTNAFTGTGNTFSQAVAFNGSGNTFNDSVFNNLTVNGGINSSNGPTEWAFFNAAGGKIRNTGLVFFGSSLEFENSTSTIYMKSPNGTRYSATVSNAGAWVLVPAP